MLWEAPPITPSTALWLTAWAKLVCELLLLALLGRGVLALWFGAMAESNPVCRWLIAVTRPALALGRWLSPRWVLPQHHGLVAFLLLAWCWLGLVALKLHWCRHGAEACT